MARYSTPEQLLGATDFSGDRLVNDPLWLVRQAKALRWAHGPLRRAAADLQADWGRGREPGDWTLPYLAFVISRIPDIQPWFDQSSQQLWTECGFSDKPPYSRVYERFTELEQVGTSFQAAAGRLIRHAKRHDKRVGEHVMFDSTEAETNSALRHVCCKPKRGRHGAPQHPARVHSADVRQERQEAAAEPAPERPEPILGDADKVRMRGGRKQVLINGHWYETLDKTAGIRAYTRGGKTIRFWHGFYNQKAVDHFTGGTLAVENFNASVQEHLCYPDVFDQLEDNLGCLPQSASLDRGFSVSMVFKHNTSRGVATVAPWRKIGFAAKGTTLRRHDFDHWDRHGVMRCNFCGGETKQIRFSANNGRPRIWVRCTAPRTPDCKRDQTISCAEDWRMLLPLSRLNPLYHQIKASHEHYERVHDDWRERYKVAGDNRSNRPKRRGIEWQNLRSYAALFIEWLRICFREGWLGSARRHDGAVKGPNGHGDRALKSLLKSRVRNGLTVPYGEAAEKLGIGLRSPPSKR
jgi:hypothetical protein